ncbi:MAG: hypothetical protein IKY52_10740 [Clostridia bacterium]|nr:hypothetical protein [Clostridia bacterium]
MAAVESFYGTLTGSITAAYVNLNENQNIEVIFNEDSVFSEKQKQMIIAYFTETDSSEDTVYGLKCTLFGHSYVEEVVRTVMDQVRATAPRCDEKFYEVQICEDCSDRQTTLLEIIKIYCCD